ncbi:MAG: RAD55 family ATPase [Candidatus Thermoplasmatota archaeon]|nr:RAD55 family ATPase [Candidatus Thermoplasmatota archaeon]
MGALKRTGERYQADRFGGARSPAGQHVQKKMAVKKPGKGKATKARSGGRRLDDLLGGGFPFRSCSLVEGPAFIGKDVFLTQFIAEGIKYGIPSLIVLTHSTTSKFRKRLVEMDYKLEEREKAGLLSYIDCHAKTVGLRGKNPFAIYLNGVDDLNALSKAMDRFQSGFGERFFYHRVVFESLSSIIRAHGINATMEFINNVATRTKTHKGIALFDLASGIHKPEEITSIQQSMDGSIVLKEEKGRHLLKVKGLSGTKGKDWVQYKFDESGFDIFGSFSYSYIK